MMIFMYRSQVAIGMPSVWYVLPAITPATKVGQDDCHMLLLLIPHQLFHVNKMININTNESFFFFQVSWTGQDPVDSVFSTVLPLVLCMLSIRRATIVHV